MPNFRARIEERRRFNSGITAVDQSVAKAAKRLDSYNKVGSIYDLQAADANMRAAGLALQRVDVAAGIVSRPRRMNAIARKVGSRAALVELLTNTIRKEKERQGIGGTFSMLRD